MRTLLQGQGLQGRPLWGWPLLGFGGPGAALAGAHWAARGRFLLKPIDDLVGKIQWYFTKPKGEKFSPAPEELESGTAKSCVWLFSPLTAALPLSSLLLVSSWLEGAHSCPGSHFPPPNVNLHSAANLGRGRV